MFKTCVAVLLFAICALAHAETPTVDETFTFQTNDRRDPFTFAKSVPRANVQNPGADPEEPRALRMSAEQIAAKKAEMLQLANMAEMSIMSDRALEALSQCNRALDVIREINLGDYRELQEPRDIVLRLHKVAERNRRRDEAERDFQIVNTHLTGVVISQKLPRAIINGKVCGAGDMIDVGDAKAQVYSIERNKVVVTYYGYRMPINLEGK